MSLGSLSGFITPRLSLSETLQTETERTGCARGASSRKDFAQRTLVDFVQFRKIDRSYDREIHKARHPIENFFADLKQYRAIATRYDKTARNFLAAVYLAAAAIWLK